MDVSELTDEQRKLFCKMFYRVFTEIRQLGWRGESEQAAALADAFHNLPLEVFNTNISFDRIRMYISRYQNKYPRYSLKDGYMYAEDNDYLAQLEQIEKMCNKD
jgi:hypothetical protein